MSFFKEGGRYTFEDVYYVRYGNDLVPVGETEFAKDSTFEYGASDMRAYIVEKTEGRYPADRIISILLKSIRSLDFDGIEKQLKQIRNFNKVIVNAVEETDIKIFCIALYGVMASGKRYLFRTAARFVKVLGEIEEDCICNGRTVVVFTKRKQLTQYTDTREQALLRSIKTSDAAWWLVEQLNIKPGVPVWRIGEEQK